MKELVRRTSYVFPKRMQEVSMALKISCALGCMSHASDKSRFQILVKVWKGVRLGKQAEMHGALFPDTENAGEGMRRVCVAWTRDSPSKLRVRAVHGSHRHPRERGGAALDSPE